jgi:subtilisin family serine protease
MLKKGANATDELISEAIYYAAGRTADGQGTWRGADILNMSWSGPPNDPVTAALDWATTQGRAGRGTPAFAASANGASGYDSSGILKTTSGQEYQFEWRYRKNVSFSEGEDTIWLGEVDLPNGTIERFDSPNMPEGWTTTGDGNIRWAVVDDPAHSYGTGRYVARAGDIADNQVTALRSPIISGGGDFRFWYWVSSEKDHDGLEVWMSVDGGPMQQFGSIFSGVPEYSSDVAYPANLSSIIAVGASTDFDYRADFSQYGDALDFVAPGGGGFRGILTTDRTGSDGDNRAASPSGDYVATTGTSFATPLAAGIAALLLSRNPELTAEEVRQIMRDTADKIGGVTYSNGFNPYYGYGRVNAAAALAAATPSLPDLAPYQPTGWSDKIVISTVPGTSTDASQITTGDTIYIDWAVDNNGEVATAVPFKARLLLNGIQQQYWPIDRPLD